MYVDIRNSFNHVPLPPDLLPLTFWWLKAPFQHSLCSSCFVGVHWLDCRAAQLPLLTKTNWQSTACLRAFLEHSLCCCSNPTHTGARCYPGPACTCFLWVQHLSPGDRQPCWPQQLFSFWHYQQYTRSIATADLQEQPQTAPPRRSSQRTTFIVRCG